MKTEHLRGPSGSDVGSVGSTEEASDAAHFTIDWVPLDAREHCTDDQQQAPAEADHGLQQELVPRGLALRSPRGWQSTGAYMGA